MNEMNILLRPVVTEKATSLQENLNQYVFEVAREANKIQIKKAVESRFKVKVIGVRTMRLSGKLKRLGRFTGRRASWKKAVISLEKDAKIDLFGQA